MVDDININENNVVGQIINRLDGVLRLLPNTFWMSGERILEMFPDQLRIGTNTPNERVPPARLDFQKNRGARVISLYT